MRVLYCNKYNFPFSGTEAYLFELMEVMRAQGHEVALFSMADDRGQPTRYDQHFVEHIDFKARVGALRKAQLAAHAIYSTQARRKIRAMIRDFRPEVAHVRNIYHHLSPSILWELKAQGVPVVYHVNDFKLLCTSYNLVSGGEACEACRQGKFWRALRPACYPGLGARTTLVAEAYVHRWLGTYRRCVDRFLAPSQFVREKFLEHGWDASKFEVLRHFQRVGLENRSPATDGPVVYCGRLSAEKGVHDLLRAIRQVPDVHLVIAGDGPQRSALHELAVRLDLHNVEFVGQIGPAERDALIARCKFTVLPSHAYETLGKAILESYAQGRPVVATDIGSRREFVHHGETGLLYRCGDVNELAQSIALLAASPAMAQEMGRAGWELVRREHRPQEHYQKLVGLYEDLIRTKVGRNPQTALALRRRHFTPASQVQTSVGGSGNPGDRLRIAFIGGRGVISKYSGIETYYEAVGQRLAGRGHELTIYCRNYFTPALKEYEGMRLVRLPTIRSKHLETFVHTLLSTLHATTQGYDVVHYHTLGPALFSFFPRMFGAKTVVTVQGLDWQRKKWGRIASGVLRLGEQASVRFPNETMVVSRTLQQRYLDLHGKQTRYVPNGGMLRERKEPRKILEWGLEPGRYVLFLGRFSPEKGCHFLVDAFEQIQTDAMLVMAGAASYCDEYSRELRKHASERIRMLDWVSGETLDELLTNAMIFVLPSDMEGLSLALLDAMAAGLCVLASDVPENREAVEGAGYVFRCGDVKDLADRLQFLIANPAVREAAGKAAAKRAREQYQWKEISENIERAYFELCGKKAVEVLPKKPVTRQEVAVEEDETRRRAG